MTSNNDLGSISPLGLSLDGAFEENGLGYYYPQFEQIFRATYEA
jgi:hypothetical protein